MSAGLPGLPQEAKGKAASTPRTGGSTFSWTQESGNSLNSLTTSFPSLSPWACAPPALSLWIPDVPLACPLGAYELTSSCLSEGNLSLEHEEEIKEVERKEQNPIFTPKHGTYTAYKIRGFSWLFSPLGQAREHAYCWELLRPKGQRSDSCPRHKFILKLADLFLWEGQYGTEKERGKWGEAFLYTRAVLNVDHLCPQLECWRWSGTWTTPYLQI